MYAKVKEQRGHLRCGTSLPFSLGDEQYRRQVSRMKKKNNYII
jgi:hypothetical protein